MASPTNATQPIGRNFIATDFLSPKSDTSPVTEIIIVDDPDYNGSGTGTAYASLDGENAALKIDIINEYTSAAGVTIDSVLIKDGGARLSNNTYLTWRNAANSADVDAIKINASDVLELASPLPPASGGIGTSGTPTNGQLPIGNGTDFSLATLTGTADQITVTNGSGTITLELEQNIDTAADVQFATVVGSTSLTTPLLKSSGAALGVQAASSQDFKLGWNGVYKMTGTANNLNPDGAGGINLGTQSLYYNSLHVNRLAFQGSHTASAKNPSTTAPDAWAEVVKGGTTYHIPLYL